MQTRAATDGISARVSRGVDLAARCTLRVGGAARYFVEATDRPLLVSALSFGEMKGLPVFVLGGGSNVIVSDQGLAGLVVQVSLRGRQSQPLGDRLAVTAQAGEPWDDFVRDMVSQGLSGLECLSGIPGRVGATPVQNVGAYGQEVSDTITAVEVLDRGDQTVRTLQAEELGFGYRNSVLKSSAADRFVVLSVTYALRPGGLPEVRYPELSLELSRRGVTHPSLEDVRQAVLAVRRRKSMVLEDGDPNARSCGSFFVNPVVSPELATQVLERAEDPTMPRFEQRDGTIKLSAAWLIERAGFRRGERHGAVGLSTRHTLALVCHTGATAAAVLDFARLIRARVEARFGVRLVQEPALWGFDNGLD